MQQAIAIAAAAGLASAFLYGVVAPGTLLFVPLTFIAPAPLMIAGLGWHPLVAALGALLAAIGISISLSSVLALSYIVMVGLPGYLVAALVLWLVRSMPPQTPQPVAGRVFGLYVMGGIAAYASLAVLVGAMAVDTSFAGFEQRLAATFERMMRGTERTPGGTDAQSLEQLSRMFVGIFVPMSAVLIALVLTFSLWISLRFLRRTERLPFTPFPAYAVKLQSDAVISLAVAIFVAMLSGFVGLYGSALAGALMFMLLCNGLAMIHQRTLGAKNRPLLLWLTWGGLFLFAPAGLLIAFAGLIDALFNLRGDRPDHTPDT